MSMHNSVNNDSVAAAFGELGAVRTICRQLVSRMRICTLPHVRSRWSSVSRAAVGKMPVVGTSGSRDHAPNS